ncbi:MAG: diphthine--ammonia ligase [Oscillospiraceae bacterium]|jgi:uncharacterized protein (TIGR00290 family)|nr:diphthine--ammonia ligase [Oscillospiraceae bacterium]
MNFAMSYSFGKDSAFALYKMLEAGHTPVCLITTVNKDDGRSWTHGINPGPVRRSAEALGLPVLLAPCGSDDYAAAFEDALKKAAAMGAEACAFGDMDVAEHLEWNEARCAAAGLHCVTPLWGMDREAAVAEELRLGFIAVIKCVDKKFLGVELLGKTLDRTVVDAIRAAGADPCGENGEYHTLVLDGPVYKKPVEIELGAIVDLGGHAVIDIR